MSNLFNSNGDIKITEIFQTTDYGKFSLIGENRFVNRLHVKRIKDSFAEKQLICPIIVNEKFEIIDGQHRFTASLESNVPLYYYVAYGYGIPEVQRLNTNQKNWTKADYMESYAAQGLEPYQMFRQFLKDFPDLNFTAAEMLLTGRAGKRSTTIEGLSANSKYFEDGDLEIPDLTRSYTWANMIMEFKPFYDGYGRKSFVAAMISLFKSDFYDHSKMIQKVKVNPRELVHCVNVAQYRELFEEIYNRRSREKVSFKYL